MNALRLKDKYPDNADEKYAFDLYQKGYRQTSRKYGTIARIDMSDEAFRVWKRKNFFDITKESAEDYYRRVITKDKIVMPSNVIKVIRRLSVRYGK